MGEIILFKKQASYHLHVHGLDVSLRVHSDRFDAQFLSGANDTTGNFTSIGNQNLVKERFPGV